MISEKESEITLKNDDIREMFHKPIDQKKIA